MTTGAERCGEEAMRDAGSRSRWRLVSITVVVVPLMTAGWMAFSSVPYTQSADAVIPKLTSTLHWSFYYWESDRIGQLIPLLAIPVRHPLWNFVFQVFLAATASALSIYFLAAYVGRSRDWVAIGTLALAGFVAFTTGQAHHVYFEGSHSYGPALALTLGGLLITRRADHDRRRAVPRAVAAFCLIALGLWVNLSVVIFVAILMAVEAFAATTGRQQDGLGLRMTPAKVPGRDVAVMVVDHLRSLIERSLVSVTTVSVALIANLVLRRLFSTGFASPWSHVKFSIVRPSLYAEGLFRLVANAVTQDMGVGAAVVIAVAAVVAFAMWWMRRDARSQPPAILFTTAILFILAMASMKYIVVSNLCHPRYIITGTMACYVGTAAVIVEMARRWMPGIVVRLRSAAVSLPLALAVVAAALFPRYRWPSLSAPEPMIRAIGGPLSAEVVESGVGFVAGDYWAVWPVVFGANLILHERGESRHVWGLAYRASVTRHRWQSEARPGTLAYLKNVPSALRHDLGWLSSYLSIRIDEPVRTTAELDYHTFSTAPPVAEIVADDQRR